MPRRHPHPKEGPTMTDTTHVTEFCAVNWNGPGDLGWHADCPGLDCPCPCHADDEPAVAVRDTGAGTR